MLNEQSSFILVDLVLHFIITVFQESYAQSFNDSFHVHVLFGG